MSENNGSTKLFTLAEVEKLAEDKDKCLLIINNRVYDISKFLDEVNSTIWKGNETTLPSSSIRVEKKC